MANVNEKMTALADEIRVLSGTTEIMGLDAMKSNVADANDTVDTQANLIAQIASALEGKAAGGGSGGSSGIQYEIVTIPAGSNSVAYTLPRVTHAFGSASLSLETVNSKYGPYNNSVVSIRNNSAYYINNLDHGNMPEWIEVEFDSRAVTYSNGILTIDQQNGIRFDVQVLLVNDPTASQISLPS